MKKICTVLMICIGFTLTACNTVRGVGQDVQKAGSAIENAVKK
jgi:predicted small secreted protein